MNFFGNQISKCTYLMDKMTPVSASKLSCFQAHANSLCQFLPIILQLLLLLMMLLSMTDELKKKLCQVVLRLQVSWGSDNERLTDNVLNHICDKIPVSLSCSSQLNYTKLKHSCCFVYFSQFTFHKMFIQHILHFYIFVQFNQGSCRYNFSSCVYSPDLS